MNKSDNLWKDMMKGNLSHSNLNTVRANNKFYQELCSNVLSSLKTS